MRLARVFPPSRRASRIVEAEDTDELAAVLAPWTPRSTAICRHPEPVTFAPTKRESELGRFTYGIEVIGWQCRKLVQGGPMRIGRFSLQSCVALITLASISPWRHHHHEASAQNGSWVAEPRSVLTVFRTNEQLATAARQAALFERGVAAQASARAAQYEALAAESSSTEESVASAGGSAVLHTLVPAAVDAEHRSA